MSDSGKDNTRLTNLYQKFLTNSCTSEEAEEILCVLEDPKNDILLKEELKSQFIQINSKRNEELVNPGNPASMDRLLDRLHHQIRLQEEKNTVKAGKKKRILIFFAKAAAILILPLLAYSAFMTFKTPTTNNHELADIVWQTVKTPAGTQTDFLLPDSSHVWLNSGSVLEYPVPFEKNIRQVKLSGEAFFDVKKDPDYPFIVNAGELNVEVKGTRFNVCNFIGEKHSELILESGSVRLFTGQYTDNKTLAFIKPGERAIMDYKENKLSVSKTDTEKYTSWKEGLLIFRDDKMDEVVTKLNRKFNVEISLKDKELKGYVYTATFSNESLSQILKLLKISAPIEYLVYKPEQRPDNSFSKQKIVFIKRKKI